MTEKLYDVQHVVATGILEYVIAEAALKDLLTFTGAKQCVDIFTIDGVPGTLYLCDGGVETLMIIPREEKDYEPQTPESKKTEPITVRKGEGQNSVPPSQRPAATG